MSQEIQNYNQEEIVQVDAYEGVMKFSRLTIIKEVESRRAFRKDTKSYYNIRMMQCVCDCGKEVVVALRSLKDGNTKSCGCLKRDVRHNAKKLVFGIGVNDSDDLIHRNGKIISSYNAWNGMLERCYSEKLHKKNHTYIGCTVCDEWLYFSNFKKWFDENYVKGYHLDKDILVKGNKIYSPETCCFVPPEINSLFVKADKIRGNLPLGVARRGSKYAARMYRNNKNIHIGTFFSINDAFAAFKEAKERYIKEVAERYFASHKITERLYRGMLNYSFNIND